MPIRLDTRSSDFGARFHEFLGTKREAAEDVEAAVRAIVADVVTRGDAALIELSRKFDRADLDAGSLRVSAAEIDAANAQCEGGTLAALRLAHGRIEAYHRRQLPQDQRFTDAIGVELGYRWTPVAAVGLYVPGGTAAYPSSVLMNAVPAKVAGVARLVMVVPAPDGELNPLVLAAAQSILITDDSALADDVERALAAQLATLRRGATARASWRDYGAIVLVRDLGEAIPLIDAIAPVHLEIMAISAEQLADKVRNTGAIFIGAHTPEAIGDYVAGSNHVLPTARSARFSSGLGVLDFMKRTSILKCGAEQLAQLGPAAIALGEAEGLDAHARSVAVRLNRR